LPGCKIDSTRSPQFNKLRESWKNSGYPSIDADLEEAFTSIRSNTQACQCRSVILSKEVLGEFLLFKYRAKNRAAREGASSGWRFYALLDKANGVLFPIIVYPKKAWQDASSGLIKSALTETIEILRKNF
jgi:hypothetical protein